MQNPERSKPMPRLLYQDMALALTEIVATLTDGFHQHQCDPNDPPGWKTVDDGVREYLDALDRHRLAIARGERLDSKSRRLHAVHLACNALIHLELLLLEETCLAQFADDKIKASDLPIPKS